MPAEADNVVPFPTKKTAFKLSEDQERAIELAQKFMASDEKYMSLIGPAGSGKSTIVKLILDMIKDKHSNFEIMLSATTHKAAQNLREITTGDVGTVHSLLKVKIKRNFKNGHQYLELDKRKFNKWDYHNSVLVIDEASMCGEDLIKIIKSVTETVKLKVIFVGDNAQLSPVGELPSVTVDPDNCPWSIAQLTTVHRQAADNPIIALATKIRLGEEFDFSSLPSSGGKGAFLMPKKNWKNQFIEQCQSEDDLNRMVVLTNRYTEKANNFIRKVKYGKDVEPYVVDEVMTSASAVNHMDSLLIQNNEDVHIHSVKSDEFGFWNLEVIRLNTEKVKVRALSSMSDRKAYLESLANKARTGSGSWQDFYKESDAISDLRPVYAGTTHKAQGSTYNDVYIDLSDMARCYEPDEHRKLLYTAITRASNAVYLTE